MGLSPVGDLGDADLERGQRGLEGVEALALDLRSGSDGEGPGGYER